METELFALAESEGIGKEELERRVQEIHKGILFNEQGIVGELNTAVLMELTGVFPSETDVQEAYGYYARNGRSIDISNLEQNTGIVPEVSRDDVNQGIRKIVNESCKSPSLGIMHIFDVEELIRKSQIMPSEEIIQGAYSVFINQALGTKKTLGSLKDLVGYTKIKPADNMINMAVKKALESADFDYIKKLVEATGVEPKISQNYAQKLYRNWLGNGFSDLEYIKKTMEVTGIAPSERMVQNAYKRDMASNDAPIGTTLKEITGIKPNISKRFVNRKYNEWIKSRDFSLISMWGDYTGIHLNLLERSAMKLFTDLIKEGDFSGLNEATRITRRNIYSLNLDKQVLNYIQSNTKPLAP